MNLKVHSSEIWCKDEKLLFYPKLLVARGCKDPLKSLLFCLHLLAKQKIEPEIQSHLQEKS